MFFVDERFVPLKHEDNNFRCAMFACRYTQVTQTKLIHTSLGRAMKRCYQRWVREQGVLDLSLITFGLPHYVRARIQVPIPPAQIYPMDTTLETVEAAASAWC